MKGFCIRNLKVFFKDRTSVFFSLLAVFIIIGLYTLFLGDVWTQNFTDMTGVRYLMDSWIMAGLLAVTSVTTTMGAFGIMVDDKVRKIDKDLKASPIKNSTVVGGYMLSSFIIGVIMCFITMALAEVYIISNGGELMSLPTFLKASGLVLLSTMINTLMILFIVSFFKSTNAFATASTVIGTIIGFLTRIYMPIGSLPEGVQWVIKCFPVSHAAVLFRKVMMEDGLSKTFAGAPVQARQEFEELMGVSFKFGDTDVSVTASIIVLVLTGAVFYILSLVKFTVKKK